MNTEDKLMLKVDRLLSHDALNQSNILNNWERQFLTSVLAIYRRINKYSLVGLSPKQKNATYNI
ncbi:hypothetical protein ACPSMW_005176, partial [Escherichia coli]|nr:hypothetical protein [Escherichia coli]EHD5600218.1 hypothetical protein [Escherichia coli]EHO1835707.1 hypothetical protein [Escherichia coli]EJH0007999.1 hypothetical protein [Escherichia coli]ELF7417690.1 hypothetical protein [Escherichia coli]